MKCPNCDSYKTRVVETQKKYLNAVIRKRKCKNCDHQFKTHEQIIKETPNIKKKTGEVEEFNLLKLERGIHIACAKFGVSNKNIKNIARSVEIELQSTDNDIVDSQLIGEIVSERLKTIHPMAYLRFASVYKQLELDDFLEEVLVVWRQWKENKNN